MHKKIHTFSKHKQLIYQHSPDKTKTLKPRNSLEPKASQVNMLFSNQRYIHQ